MEKMQIDLSTINQKVLNELPVYNGSYKIDSHIGSGCFLDAPGYPSYFIQSIYTRFGDCPAFGANEVIQNRVIRTDKTTDKEFRDLIKSLWIKVPYRSIRTKAWITQLYMYFHNCYVNDAIGKDCRHADKLVIFPIPSYQLKMYIEPRNKTYKMSKEMRNKRRDAIATQNDKIIEDARKIAIPKNHAAYRHILEYYPRAKPNLELIKNVPKSAPNWYERLPEKPNKDNCPGEQWQKHPVAKNYCQVCGWRE